MSLPTIGLTRSNYLREQQARGERESNTLQISLRIPRISSFRWLLKLYCLVLGGLGVLLCLVWEIFQLYVLAHTTNAELRQQRYVDILLGLLLLASLLCLLWGSHSESRLWVIAFITGSLAVVLSYWCCYLYTTHATHLEDNYPDTEGTIAEVATTLSVLYGVLLLPVLVLYRSLELDASNGSSHQPSSPREEELKPPQYHEGPHIPCL